MVRSHAFAACAGLLAAIAAPAAPPGEVSGVRFDDPVSLAWDTVPAAGDYNVYRGILAAGAPGRCHGFAVAPPFLTADEPDPGVAYFYLVTAVSAAGEEGSPGLDSFGNPRPLLGPCAAVMRGHVLDRTGYGWGEWAADRIESLGLAGYIAEQLEPASINEATNADLLGRLAPISRPADIVQLIQHRVIQAVYARRQLEQQVATFWANHFNTDWSKVAELYQGAFPACQGGAGNPPQCDPLYPARAYSEASMAQFRELNAFRTLAFGGDFRAMLEASALSPAMIIYLDTFGSVAGAPNENYARELLELHALGVDGGYTQSDVEELSRVMTGWSLCKKAPGDYDDPLAACIPAYWDTSVPGEIVATFVAGAHDCTAKTLFAGTPQEVTIADSCATPALGAGELEMALDAIASHPATARFISKKILECFVTEDPPPALVDDLVAAWDDAGNPHGVGDMQAVLGTALTSGAFLDPDRVRGKIKTPLEQFASALRAMRGATDGKTGILDFLVAAGHLPHYNPVPTGWPEDGASWIGTNNYLDRQNFGLILLGSASPLFGQDLIGLLGDHGVDTTPGHGEAIVDFLGTTLFGGAWTPAERGAALEFLGTDDLGVPAPHDDARIRELAALLLGDPKFQEQ